LVFEAAAEIFLPQLKQPFCFCGVQCERSSATCTTEEVAIVSYP